MDRCSLLAIKYSPVHGGSCLQGLEDVTLRKKPYRFNLHEFHYQVRPEMEGNKVISG
jgi:hypothetical protein